MKVSVKYERLILALDDKQLESFVRAWAENKKGYFRVTVLAGAGDRGRDVVGYLTKDLDAGSWHNYQCKQYGKTLPTANGLAELGKVLYYAFIQEFTAPSKFYFVAPLGLNRNLRSLVNNPKALRKKIIDEWDEYCADEIIDGQKIVLTAELKAFISAWDFSNVEHISLDAILEDDAAKGVMFKWFDKDPGPAPAGKVPTSVQTEELQYVAQLLEVYGERDSCTFSQHEQVSDHPDHGPHLSLQRERFYDADAFARFYRDNTMEDELIALRREILHGVIDECRSAFPDGLARVDAVMKQAASVHPSGVLGRHAAVPVKQGVCHHFANEGALKWRK